MERSILTLQNLTKSFPQGRTILSNLSLSFLAGAKIGVLGVNGSGKSTLLRIMAGLDKDFVGEMHGEQKLTIGYLPQEPQLDAERNVASIIYEGLGEKKALLDRFHALTAQFGEVQEEEAMTRLLDEQASLQEQIDAHDAWDMEREAEIAAEALRCPEGDSKIDTLSGGEKRRVALCSLLLSKPDLLLLDEPTNHLDAETVAWLERHLRESTSTVVMVTHDRYFLDNVTGWILELDRGRAYPHKGNYRSWLSARTERLRQEGKDNAALERALLQEQAWIGKSQKARAQSAQKRISEYESRLQRAEQAKFGEQRITIPPGPRLGEKVVEARALTKILGDKLLFEELTFSLPQGGIVGVIGANGAGKTTLLRLLTGADRPDSGSIELGDSVVVGYVDQSRETLFESHSVWQEISAGADRIALGKGEVSSRAYVASFNFRGGDQQKRVGDLSGGERNRVHLAKLLKCGANLLLLDEPTNDLDIETLRALEMALESFPGCVVIASHDRWFLDRLATHILAFEGEGSVLWFEGDFAAYLEDKQRRLGVSALQPKRYKYKRLTRN